MNYLTRKWSQVQNVHENAMTIDTSELTINVLYWWNPDLFTIVHKKDFMIFFTVTLQPFMKYNSYPLFSVTQHHEKRWDPPTPYAWRKYWTAPYRNQSIDLLCTVFYIKATLTFNGLNSNRFWSKLELIWNLVCNRDVSRTPSDIEDGAFCENI